MNKKILNISLFILMLTGYQHAVAHGGGGGSYDFDNKDYAADRAAKKKVAEQKNDEDDWANFMKAVNTPKQKKGENVIKGDGHHEAQ